MTQRLFHHYLIAALLLLLGTATPALPRGEASVEERLDRLERMLSSQSMSDIVLQLQRLQQEVKQLRGELEVQGHTLDTLGSRARDTAPAADNNSTVIGERPALSPVGAGITSTNDPARDYQKAFELLKQGNYPDAITAFRAFLATYPRGAYADNAQYWLGEANYVTRDFDAALNEFSKVPELYPNSNKVAGAWLKMGYIYQEKGQPAKTLELLEQLLRKYPDSTEARLAKQRLDGLRRDGH